VQNKQKGVTSVMSRKAELILEYQNYIDQAPVPTAQLYGQACSNDRLTIDSWRATWIKNVQENHKKFGSFADKSIGKLLKHFYGKPVILAGSGPSLKVNAHLLKNRGEAIGLVSCLHNFHFLEDLEAGVDFYVTLDAGEVVVEEVYEGGSKTPDEYWEMTKDKKLLAFIGTSPRLLEKWQGEIYFYNCPVPDAEYMKAVDDLELFQPYIGTGGNVLGACTYIAKCIFGAGMLAFIGADFSFSNDSKFHAWDSKYDAKMGYVVPAFNVYGHKVKTWQSYLNFKSWFDWLSGAVPGIYINCTEGGIFGSYAEGNIMGVKQMELARFLEMIQICEVLTDQCANKPDAEKKIIF
jgi:hypothetical protein